MCNYLYGTLNICQPLLSLSFFFPSSLSLSSPQFSFPTYTVGRRRRRSECCLPAAFSFFFLLLFLVLVMPPWRSQRAAEKKKEKRRDSPPPPKLLRCFVGAEEREKPLAEEGGGGECKWGSPVRPGGWIDRLLRASRPSPGKKRRGVAISLSQ